MRLSPLFNHAMPGQPGADYIDITMGSLKAFGTGWDNWMASKDALKLMVAQNNLAICTFKFARESNRVAKTDALDAPRQPFDFHELVLKTRQRFMVSTQSQA